MADRSHQSRPLDYHKVNAFFENPDTSDLYDRQIALLKRVVRKSSNGFYIEDIEQVSILLTHVHNRSDMIEFEWSLIKLLDIVEKPLNRQKANEELYPSGVDKIKKVIEVLALLIGSRNEAIRLKAIKTVRVYMKGQDMLRDNSYFSVKGLGGVVIRQEQRPTPCEYNNQMLLQCKVVEAVAQQLYITTSDYMDILQEEIERKEAIKNELDRISKMKEEEEARQREIEANTFTVDVVKKTPEQLEQERLQALEEAEEKFWASDEIDDDGQMEGALLLDNNDNSNNNTPTNLSKSEIKRRKRHLLIQQLDSIQSFTSLKVNVNTLVSNRLMESCVLLLKVIDDTKDSIIETSIDIIWRCLEFCHEIVQETNPASSVAQLLLKHRIGNAGYQLENLPFDGVLLTFKSLLYTYLQEGYRDKDKDLRNSLLVILSILARQEGLHQEFVSSGTLALLLTFATVCETGFLSDPTMPLPDIHNYGTHAGLDIEFKRLLWGILVTLLQSSNVEVLNCITESPILDTLLLYCEYRFGQNTELKDSQNYPLAITKASESEVIFLQRQAVVTLLYLLPLIQDQFLSRSGPEIMIHLLSFTLPTDDTDYKYVELQRHILAAMVASATFPSYSDRYGTVPCFLSLLKIISKEDKPEVSRTRAANILSIICKDNEQNKANFYQCKGSKILVNELNRHFDKLNSGKKVSSLENKQVYPLVTAVIDAVWSTVIGNRQCTSVFLDEGGLDSLIDCLYISPYQIRFQIIGALNEFLSISSDATSYSLAWRSTDDLASFPQLLLRIWTEEEQRLNVSRPGGVIASLDHPLGSHNLEEESEAQQKAIENISTSNVAFSRLNEAKVAAKEIESENIFDEHNNAGESDSMVSNFSNPPTTIYGNNKGNGIAEAKSMILDIRGRLAMLIQLLIKDTENNKQNSEWESYLSREEKMASLMAENYQEFGCLASWTNIKRCLEEEGVIPNKSDAEYIQSRIERYFATAAKIKYEQRNLTEKAQSDRLSAEWKDYKVILDKRDQEIEQLRLKKFQYRAKSRKDPDESEIQDEKSQEKSESVEDHAHADEEASKGSKMEGELVKSNTDFTKNGNVTEGASTTTLEDDSEYAQYTTTNITEGLSNESLENI